MQPPSWGPRSRDGVCSAQWQRAGLNWPGTLTTQGCLCDLVLRNSHFFLQQWLVRAGSSAQRRASTELLCNSLGRNSRYWSLLRTWREPWDGDSRFESEVNTWNQASEKFWSCGHLILVGGPRLSGMKERKNESQKSCPAHPVHIPPQKTP